MTLFNTPYKCHRDTAWQLESVTMTLFNTPKSVTWTLQGTSNDASQKCHQDIASHPEKYHRNVLQKIKRRILLLIIIF